MSSKSKHIYLFKFIIALSFPIAGIVHYFIPIISWLKNQNLFVTCFTLTAYYFGFFIGNQYVLLSKSSLSRIVGILFTSHVITTIVFAAYGYHILSIILSIILGITTGGLLSLPSYIVLKPPRFFILSLTPLLGAGIIFVYGFDEVLLLSGILAFFLSIFLLLSLKIVVVKPKLIEKTQGPIIAEGIILALGVGIGSSIINIIVPIIALIVFKADVIHIGAVFSISLIIIQLIGWRVLKQERVHRAMGSFILASLIFSVLLMSLIEDLYLFLFLWILAIVDISFLNSFITIINRSIKKFD
ncbi:MAG: hypothetical protein NZ922_05790, partial [Candidatus Methanomethyliaceae archaeon]|nr:hypothetical protein [Candidatus Methanomethyliaceae archaeon]MDW7970884.1 hypothetical protein [Nitrososphaerota archaeon]